MARELLDVVVEFVSYVDKAANKRKFILTKSAEGYDGIQFEKPVTLITKSRDPQKLVYGIVYEPNVVDSQGDLMSEAAIEKAAHKFLSDFRQIDQQHNFSEGAGVPVESYIMPADGTIGNQFIKKGTWILVTKASDEVWEKIQDGTYTGYSLAGRAKETREVEKTKKSFVQMVKDFFGSASEEEKDEVVLTFKELTKEDSGIVGETDESVESNEEEKATEETTKSESNSENAESKESDEDALAKTEETESTEELIEKVLKEKLEAVTSKHDEVLLKFEDKLEKLQEENKKLQDQILQRKSVLPATAETKKKSYGKADTLI